MLPGAGARGAGGGPQRPRGSLWGCPRRGSLGVGGGGVRLRLTLGSWEGILPEHLLDRGERWEG